MSLLAIGKRLLASLPLINIQSEKLACNQIQTKIEDSIIKQSPFQRKKTFFVKIIHSLNNEPAFFKIKKITEITKIENNNEPIVGYLTTPVTDNIQGAPKATKLSDAWEEIKKQEGIKNQYIVMPFAQTEGNRMHWTLLFVNFKDKKAYIVDPKYATPLTLPHCVKKLDRREYDYAAIAQTLKDNGIENCEVRFLGIQNFLNRNLCGYRVANKAARFIRGKKKEIPTSRRMQRMEILKEGNIPPEISERAKILHPK